MLAKRRFRRVVRPRGPNRPMAARPLPGSGQAFAHAIPGAYVVTVKQLLTQLQQPALKARWPISRIADAAGLPKSQVYRAMCGEEVTLRTLAAIAKVFHGEVVIMLRRPRG